MSTSPSKTILKQILLTRRICFSVSLNCFRVNSPQEIIFLNNVSGARIIIISLVEFKSPRGRMHQREICYNSIYIIFRIFCMLDSRKKCGIKIPHLVWMVIYAHPLCTYMCMLNVYVSCIRNFLHKSVDVSGRLGSQQSYSST